MARRVILSSKFAAIIERQAAGGAIGMFRAPRRRMTTLTDIAEDLIDTTQRLVDEPAESGRRRQFGGLPGTVAGGRRNPNYDFRRRRSGVGSRTYRSSLSTNVEKKSGKLIVMVRNDHPHADDVEFGTRRDGTRIVSRNYMAIPLTQRAYRRWQASRNLSRAQRRARGWPSAAKGAEWERRKRREKAYGFRNAAGKKLKGKKLQKNLYSREGIKLSKGRSGHNRQFPAIHSDGRPALFTRVVKNYDGYAIIRRAIRIVANKRGLN